MRFTDASVNALKLPPGKSELLVFDDALAGFGLRIRAGGKRTWVVQYRLGTNQRRLSLGSLQSIDAVEARRRAKSALAQVQLGQDPQAQKLAARVPKAREIAVSDLVDRYLASVEARLKTSTYSGIVLHLRKHWQPLHKTELVALATPCGGRAGSHRARKRALWSESLTSGAKRNVRLGDRRRADRFQSCRRNEQGH